MKTTRKHTEQSASPAPQGQPTAILSRVVDCIRVEPVTLEVLRALLTTAQVAKQSPDGSLTVAGTPWRLAELDSSGGTRALYTRFVWEPVIRQVLNRAGFAIERRGQESQVLPAPAQKPLGRFDPVDRALLQTVQQHEAAVVRFEENNVDLARLIAQVALAWPNKTVTVVVPEREQAGQLAKALRSYPRLARDVSVITARSRPARVGRVAVCTYTGLGHTPDYLPRNRAFDVYWLDIVIVLDAISATWKLAPWTLGRASRARVYGLLAEGARLSPLEKDQLTSLFGFQTLTIPRHGHRERLVQLARYTIRGGMELPSSRNGVPLKRRGLWHNAVRNRKIIHQIGRASCRER